ncbi:hypothetical protein [Clostridium fungisolvens]|uniref:Uncharacterized protein n=1 Tax=Clostridium fungisolvens TaxID=1604897 RepID=A0A6V8SB90_9CLOT|nr:hypothetical protein [Clostridium fungisolvens]GFP74497.1 hypothetical protein bsdtw1_00549 [Clostridium fungisolvens]
MGARLVKSNFFPKENEPIEAIIKMPEEKRSIIHGVVKDWKSNPVKDVVVKLFEVINPGPNCTLKPITHTFTDECGQFLFGPIWSNKKYSIKVWFNDVKIRQLIITPDCDEPYDADHDHVHNKPYERDTDRNPYQNQEYGPNKRSYRKDDFTEYDDYDDR